MFHWIEAFGQKPACSSRSPPSTKSFMDDVADHVSCYSQKWPISQFSFLGNQTNTFPLLWNYARVAESAHPLSDCLSTCLDHVSCDSVHAMCHIITEATALLASVIVTSMCLLEARSMCCQSGVSLLRMYLKGSAHLACASSPFDNGNPCLALVGPDLPVVLTVIFLAMCCTCLMSFRRAAFTAFCACRSSLSRVLLSDALQFPVLLNLGSMEC